MALAAAQIGEFEAGDEIAELPLRVALVRAGEELRHAYVETDAAAPMRAAQLARFGFRCDCARCAREMGGARRRETLGE